ncbi:glycosyltransferase family 25 protein [Aurantiacibacter odishensis]|uniref:glycosyltransferase family 25 protein n=1 Tax=Aurantiacibacter odishensis TaxID=1155476 RepID=UPI000E71A885|nr:glycosyltransferase family 25 protein [Aurantiacibacter odishensis]
MSSETPAAASRPTTGIRVISMSDAAERREAFAQRTEGISASWSFFDACTSLHSTLRYDAAEVRSTYGRELSKGEIGCYSSHYALWEELLRSDADQYLILEDDVLVDWAMVDALCATDLGTRGLHYLRLFYKYPVRHMVRQRDFVSDRHQLVELFGWSKGTQGYIVTRRGAEILHEACARLQMPIDDQMDRSWVHGLPNMTIFPAPLIEQTLPSQIGDDRYASKSGMAGVNRFRRDEESKIRAMYLREKAKSFIDRRFRSRGSAS